MSRTAPPATSPGSLDRIAAGLTADGVRDTREAGERNFRIGPQPYPLSAAQHAFFLQLGDDLLAFYQTLNLLYRRAQQGQAPGFVRRWLDAGKPEEVLRLARMGRFKAALPGVIRPDVLYTDTGPVITELDSVPGGIGLTDSLNRHYAAAGYPPVGGADGMVDGMAAMLKAHSNAPNPVVAVTVSDESDAYRPEMTHLCARLKEKGVQAETVHPEELICGPESIALPDGRKVDVLYRFFELFDLAGVPQSDALLHAAKMRQVAMTPPPKPQLEEKLAMALFHHPALAPFWRGELGEAYPRLARIFPPTWVLDPAPLPDHAVIPGLMADGLPVWRWEQLLPLGKKSRELVVKPSGFSETAWGSRGVIIGHDMPETAWAEAVREAVAAFDTTPHILQPFRKAVSEPAEWWHEAAPDERFPMRARTRLCPYYFVTGASVRLGGILATLCPADKKRIHGMSHAVMVPCQVVDG